MLEHGERVVESGRFGGSGAASCFGGMEVGGEQDHGILGTRKEILKEGAKEKAGF